MESTASVLFDKPIDLTSVTLFSGVDATLAVFDITANLPITTVNVSVSDAPNGAQSLNISPKSGYWTRGHHYGIVVVGGANGVKGKESGQTVTGSPTWALVVSGTALVKCDQNGNNCVLGTSAIPTTEKDPAAQYAALR